MNLHARCSSLFVIVIQLSYTAGISIFWLADLYHVILGCDETTSLTSLSWCKFNTSLSLHHGFGWLKLWPVFFFFFFFFAVHLIWIIKYVNALIFRELSGFTCIRLLARNSKFSLTALRGGPVRCWNFIINFIIVSLCSSSFLSFSRRGRSNKRAKKRASEETRLGWAKNWGEVIPYIFFALPPKFVRFLRVSATQASSLLVTLTFFLVQSSYSL